MSQTLLDLAALKNTDREVGLIDENKAVAPEMTTLPSRVIQGMSYRTAVVSGQGAGSFRAINSGVPTVRAQVFTRLTECFPYEAPIKLDALLQAASQGEVADMEMLQASIVLKTAFQRIGAQIFQGTENIATGFSGLKQFTPKTATAGASSIVVDATGTAANTASSAYLVKFGLPDVHLVFGNDTTIQVGEFFDQLINDGAGGEYMGRVASLKTWVGLAIGNTSCVGRILNLTAETGKGLTDALIARAMSLFPTGYTPDAIFVSRRSDFQLAASRPRTNFSLPAQARPGNAVAITDYTSGTYQGIPIIPTDSISDVQAIE